MISPVFTIFLRSSCVTESNLLPNQKYFSEHKSSKTQPHRDPSVNSTWTVHAPPKDRCSAFCNGEQNQEELKRSSSRTLTGSLKMLRSTNLPVIPNPGSEILSPAPINLLLIFP